MLNAQSQNPTLQSALQIFNAESKGSQAEAETSDSEESSPDSISLSENSPEESQETADTEPAAPAAEDVGEIFVTDETGRKKIKVNWGDKEKLKKYVEMAYGFRKTQSERDKLTKELEPLRTKAKELESSWDALESAYKSDGYKGLVNLIAGDEQGWEKLLEAEFAKREAWSRASPEQRKALELEVELTRERREREALKKKVEEDLKKAETERLSADEEYLKARVVPAFNKYRFEGKLGDEAMERRIDRAIWDEVMEQLGEVSGSTEITSQLADKKFREVAQQYQKLFKVQTEKKSQELLTNKKAKAAETAATIAKSKMKPQGTLDDETMQHVKSGDIVSAFKSFFKA